MKIFFVVLFLIAFLSLILTLFLPDFIRDKNNDLHEVNIKLKNFLRFLFTISTFTAYFVAVVGNF